MARRLVSVDTSFLQQCVGNVLDNAAKYGYEQHPGVASPRSPGRPSSPSPSPVPASRCSRPIFPRLATELARRHCAQRHGEGSGLGLWIVDHLTRAMGGRVLIDASAELTTVRLVLPLA